MLKYAMIAALGMTSLIGKAEAAYRPVCVASFLHIESDQQVVVDFEMIQREDSHWFRQTVDGVVIDGEVVEKQEGLLFVNATEDGKALSSEMQVFESRIVEKNGKRAHVSAANVEIRRVRPAITVECRR